MTATGTNPKPCKSQCLIVVPGAIPPIPADLDRLSEEDAALVQKVFEEPAEFIDHELFRKPAAETILFGRKANLPPDATYFEEVDLTDPAVKGGGLGTTLSSAEEIRLFQRFNYARMRLYKLLEKHRGKHMPFDTLRELLAWTHRAMMARGQIVQANLPLVLAMGKRTRLSGLDFNELMSEGNFALLRSADKFDCSRGFKFSTYACRAILKSFSRVAMRTSRYRGHFPTEFDPTLEKSDFTDRKRDHLEAACVDEIRDILAHNLADLNDMEQTVIRARFALDGGAESTKPKTLEQVGELIGVTKERVRQIQNRALGKIRSILDDSFLAA